MGPSPDIVGYDDASMIDRVSDSALASTGQRSTEPGHDVYLMAVPITLGALPEIGKAQPLFETNIESVTGFTWHQYDVSQDGQRFLVNTPEAVKPP